MAKRFRFRLEPVLRQRTHEEEARLRDFAEVQRLVVEQQGYLQGLLQEKAACQAELHALYATLEDFNGVVERQRYINTVNLRHAMGERRLAELNQHLEARRGALMEARKRRRAIEILKERQAEEHRRQEVRREALELDELAIQRFRAGAAEH